MIHDQETFSCFPSPTDERRPRRVVVLIMYLDCYWLQDNYESLARCLQSSLVWADGLRQQYTLYPIDRLYSVKTNIFQNAFFWYFFIKNDLSRVDLIIKMVLEFLSNL